MSGNDFDSHHDMMESPGISGKIYRSLHWIDTELLPAMHEKITAFFRLTSPVEESFEFSLVKMPLKFAFVYVFLGLFTVMAVAIAYPGLLVADVMFGLMFDIERTVPGLAELPGLAAAEWSSILTRMADVSLTPSWARTLDAAIAYGLWAVVWLVYAGLYAIGMWFHARHDPGPGY